MERFFLLTIKQLDYNSKRGRVPCRTRIPKCILQTPVTYCSLFLGKEMKKEEEEKKVGWQSKYTEGKLAIGIDYYKFNYTQILKFYLLFQDFLIRS